MSNEQQKISWCKGCGLTFVTTFLPEACGSCKGQLLEIGWVEESNEQL